jgi:cytochrome c-type biogenesis protein
MDLESIRTTLEQASLASLAISLLAGLFFSFNPVAFAAIPVSLAYVTKAREPKQAALFGGMFILGLVLTHVLLGLTASLGGQWFQTVLGRQWGLVLGPLLIALGLVWLGWIRIPLPAIAFAFRARRAATAWSAFALGVPFSVAICPFCSPVLLILLGVAAGAGSPLFGSLLLLAFAIGRVVPIIIGSVAIGWLQNLSGLARFQRVFELIGGTLLILAGLYMLNAVWLAVPSLAV